MSRSLGPLTQLLVRSTAGLPIAAPKPDNMSTCPTTPVGDQGGQLRRDKRMRAVAHVSQVRTERSIYRSTNHYSDSYHFICREPVRQSAGITARAVMPLSTPRGSASAAAEGEGARH